MQRDPFFKNNVRKQLYIIMGTYLKDCFVNYKQKFDKTSHLNSDFVYNNKCFRNVNVILQAFPSAFDRF